MDLDRFDPAFFERLRSRVVAARDRGMYVGIMLFSPDSGAKREDWNDLLYHPANNVQGINADTNGDGSGAEAYDLSIPRITAYQEAFVRKVVDTVNDLDNVLYEIGNEGDLTSVPWQYHFIRFIKQYEAGKPKQHPVGMTAVFNILKGSWATDNRVLFESPADWISPGIGPLQGQSSGRRRHEGDHRRRGPHLADRSASRLDLEVFPQRNPADPDGLVFLRRSEMDFARRAGGDAQVHGIRADLCQEDGPGGDDAPKRVGHYRVLPGQSGQRSIWSISPRLARRFSVELKAGTYRYEWFDPAKGAIAETGRLGTRDGGRQFKAPFEGDAVLYLKAQ